MGDRFDLEAVKARCEAVRETVNARPFNPTAFFKASDEWERSWRTDLPAALEEIETLRAQVSTLTARLEEVEAQAALATGFVRRALARDNFHPDGAAGRAILAGDAGRDFIEKTAARLAEVEAETLERAAKAVCSYVGRCNSNRCPCQTIRSLASKKGTDK